MFIKEQLEAEEYFHSTTAKRQQAFSNKSHLSEGTSESRINSDTMIYKEQYSVLLLDFHVL